MGVSGQEGSGQVLRGQRHGVQGEKAGLEGADKGMGNPPIYVLTADELATWTEADRPVTQKWIDELSDPSRRPGGHRLHRRAERDLRPVSYT